MNAMINRIDRAIDMTAVIVEAVPADRMNAPTPCLEWDLRELLNHLVGGMNIFAAQLHGVDPGRDHHDDWLGADPHGAYIDAAITDRAAWHRPDALERTVRLGFGAVPGSLAAIIHLTELVVHGLDIAVASGLEDLLDQRLCEELLAIMHGMDFDNFRRPGMFGPECAAAPEAAAHLRLLAYVGRSGLVASVEHTDLYVSVESPE
ncbi:TIGR03086 family metal-binding protein [Nocardia sp. KC 131]|uniref:TIGR03086 family metal-binding protein n=1 Tax=Nocardia arseniciresistens TaxID=3392119 RepID=UPI00398EF23C